MEDSNALAAAVVSVLVLTASIQTCSPARVDPGAGRQQSSSTDFIRARCASTTYPALCVQTLSSHATAIHASPTQLAQAALSVSLAGARSASAGILQLSTGSRGSMGPREACAVKDCVEELGNSVDELRQSLAQMGHLRGAHRDFLMNSVQTWVSAALTDDDTCMDGFAEAATDAGVKDTVRRYIENVAHLTSNALALINAIATVRSPEP